ncbi:MAG: YfcE family phosphodiesterase [archaeon]|nr:YfcE family phosphodiesterase [archaeon]
MKDEIIIGLISDTHIYLDYSDLFELVLVDFKKKEVDYIFHMGDFVSFSVLEKLISVFGDNKVIAVIGNMDKGDQELVKKLPKKLQIELLGHKIFCTHGTGAPWGIINRLNKNHDLSEYDIVIFGHTHHSINKIHDDGKTYINPGTCRKGGSYGFLQIAKDKIEVKIVNL